MEENKEKKKIKLNVRLATIQDITSLYNLNKVCLPIYYSIPEHALMISTHIYYVAELGKNLIGYLIAEDERDNIHIVSIGISDIYRGKGVGTYLIKRLRRNNGQNKTVSLNVHIENEKAINFYKKNGFEIKETRKDYYVESLNNCKSYDALYMKTL